MLKPKQGFFSKKFLIFALGALFAGGYALFFWHAPKAFAEAAKPLVWYERWPLDVLSGIIYVIVSLAGKLIGVFMGFWFNIIQYNNFIRSPFVKTGWIIIRDICNLGFVLILLAISLGSILHIERYSYRVYLPKLLLMAILINFSKLICGVIIDAGQVLMMTFGSAIINIGAGNIMNSLGITVLLNLSPDTPTKITGAAILGSVILAGIFAVIALIVITIITVILVVRIVMLWILIVFSPIAYLFSASPIGKSYASQWWSEFIKWVFYGPILVFLIWLSLETIQVSIKKVFLTSAKAGSVSLVQIGDPAVMSSFVLGIILLMASLATAQKLGGISGRLASSAYSGIVARGYRVADWAQRKAMGTVTAPWKATKYAVKGVATGLDSYAATKTKTGMSPLQILRNIKQLPKAIDKEFDRRTAEKYGQGMSRAGEIISGQREANLLQTILAKSSRPEYMAKNILSPRKEKLFLSSKKRIETAKELKDELNFVEEQEGKAKEIEEFIKKIKKSGGEEEIKEFLSKPASEKKKYLKEKKQELDKEKQNVERNKQVLLGKEKNEKNLKEKIKEFKEKLRTADTGEKKKFFQGRIKKKKQELAELNNEKAPLQEKVEQEEKKLKEKEKVYSLMQEAWINNYSNLDDLEKDLAKKKKAIAQSQQKLGKELFEYAPREVAELRLERAKKVREKLQELEDVEDTNTLISILDDALKKRDKATVEAVLRKTFNNGDYADVLRHYNYQTDYKGLQNFMDALADKKSNVYSGFNQWQARSLGAGLSNVLRSQGQYSAYGAFVNKNGMWERIRPEDHIKTVLERRNSSSLTKNLRDTGLLGYGYYTPEGEFRLSPAGLAYLKSIDNDRGRELVVKELNQQVAAELNRHLEEIKTHVSEKMAEAIKKRVSGQDPEEFIPETIAKKFAELEKKLEAAMSDQFKEQEAKDEIRRKQEKAEEKEEKRQEEAKKKNDSSNNNSSQFS